MKMVVNTNNGGALNLRSAPNGPVIGTIPNKTSLEVEMNGDWAQTTYNNLTGYVKSSFLSQPITKEDLQKIYNSLQQTLKTIEGVLN